MSRLVDKVGDILRSVVASPTAGRPLVFEGTSQSARVQEYQQSGRRCTPAIEASQWRTSHRGESPDPPAPCPGLAGSLAGWLTCWLAAQSTASLSLACSPGLTA